MAEELEVTTTEESVADVAGTQEAARRMAKVIAEGMKDEKTETTKLEGEATKATEATEAAGAEAAEATETAEVEEEEQVDLTETEKILAEAGIDLGMAAGEVPAELLPVYSRLVQSGVDLVQNAMAQQLEASQAVKQVEEFAERLEKSPDKLLLMLAVTKPEVFAKAVEVFNEMQQNERVKDMAIKELQSEARLQEANRKETLLVEYERRTKARQVIAATRQASRIHGVPFELAERVVALAVQANGGDLDVGEVSTIVSELKAAPRKAVKTKVASAEKVTATKGANTTEIAGTKGTTSTGLKEATERDKGGGIFRRLVKEASAKIKGIS